MNKRYFYNKEKEITSEEAHALEDKSGLMTSDKEIKFKEKKGEKKDGGK